MASMGNGTNGSVAGYVRPTTPPPGMRVESVNMLNWLQKGMTVKLKSGGPQMTVNKVTTTGANCVWFNNRGDIQDHTFAMETLVIIANSDGTSGSADSMRGVTGKIRPPQQNQDSVA